ncbi:MAG: Competence protein ComM [Burkholderia gladioli]|nr:MAG: Competence protein ComM [Burkholderia gladioli]
MGILAANGDLPPAALAGREFAGELSLTVALRPMRGAFAMACGIARSALAAESAPRGNDAADSDAETPASRSAAPELYLPSASATEAALAPGVTVYGAPDLPSLCAHLSGAADARLAPIVAALPDAAPGDAAPDLADVVGQQGAKRALEIAAAGAGKSMLAARLPSLLPPMTDDEALTSTALLSASRLGFSPAQWRKRSFRTPHHSSSAAALVGGRNPPQPGEITLAHHGVLFLDELPEFDRHVLEMLGEPLEAGRITISRVALQADFPAACQLAAAMNPCPSGWRGDPSGRCTPEVSARYLRKLSGPQIDRIDLQIALPALSPTELAERGATPAEPSAAVARRVAASRERQLMRQGKTNQMLSGRETDAFCRLDPTGERLLREAGERFHWSARAYYRVLKVARTIADLAGDTAPDAAQIGEAIRYRRAVELELV